jgi:large subunit ribosomal protein L18e
MKSKTKIEKQLQRKTKSSLVRTIISTKKNDKWLEVAKILSGPRSKRANLNLKKIDEESKAGETIIIPGKVLSQGEITKKIKIVALGFSEKAKEKLLKSKSETLSILEEIKKNPEAKGIKILKAELKNSTLSKTKEIFNK